MAGVSRRSLLASTAAATVAVAVPGILATGSVAETLAAPLRPALKAFAVLDQEERQGDIYFAASDQEALRLAGVCEGEEDEYDCYHESWADRFAPEGAVPAHEAVVRGWRFECCGCGRTVSDDMDDFFEEADEDDARAVAAPPPLDGILGTTSSSVFCSVGCKCRHETIEAEKKAAGAAMIESLKQTAVARFGMVEFDDDTSRLRPHAFVHYHNGVCVVEQAIIRFRFPGQKIDSAEYQIDRPMTQKVGHRWVEPIGPFLPELSVCAGDAAAFNAWIGKDLFRVPEALPAPSPSSNGGAG